MILSTCLLIALIAGILALVTAITKPEKKQISFYNHPDIMLQLAGFTTLWVLMALGLIYLTQDCAPENAQYMIPAILVGLYGAWSMTKKHFRKKITHRSRMSTQHSA